ncbi:hypothetical protein [Actinoplanes sp. NPDC051494]|uniref:hypothetical protein n=1 Tax=Actinoplanes sp. NPDC051494 TaxID=3363907 RepID=UPI0037B912D7
MGADLRGRTVERQQELSARHEALGREETDTDRYHDLLWRVFDATNDLITVLDETAARAARRRRLAALLLVLLALGTGVPAVLRIIAGYALIIAAALLVAGVTLWLTARPGKRRAPAEPEEVNGDEQ